MASVFIPALMRKLTGGRERVTATGRNIGQIIESLEGQFPGIRAQLLEGTDLKASVAVSIDGEMATGGLLEPVKDSSDIYIVPALSGGTGVSIFEQM
jgi:molybdopterin synthase sulfur carrier subunit